MISYKWIHIVRSVLLRLRSNKGYSFSYTPITECEEYTQALIYDSLTNDVPCMIARFGSVELQAVIDSLYPPTIGNAIRFVMGEAPAWGYAHSTMRAMRINAGFFPAIPSMLDRFGVLMQECMKEVDILGSWRPEETEILDMMPQVKRVQLHSLEPYYFKHTWMPALENKKVLVIHPFENTIRTQYALLDKLFDNPEMSPTYELKTIKAVQSIAGNKPDDFGDWFDALEWMKREIDKVDFNIAIIGCGAYGFPLAAYVKQIGKKAIHLGGATQYLFGITSNAAEKNPAMKGLINDYWTRPSLEETPIGIKNVENYRYW